jgi:hypothetical protein
MGTKERGKGRPERVSFVGRRARIFLCAARGFPPYDSPLWYALWRPCDVESVIGPPSHCSDARVSGVTNFWWSSGSCTSHSCHSCLAATLSQCEVITGNLRVAPTHVRNTGPGTCCCQSNSIMLYCYYNRGYYIQYYCTTVLSTIRRQCQAPPHLNVQLQALPGKNAEQCFEYPLLPGARRKYGLVARSLFSVKLCVRGFIGPADSI